MKRKHLLSLLHQYNPIDKQEHRHKQHITEFVQQNSDCFERTLTTGHITASCWLLNYKQTHALLLHHKKFNAWIQLGGHCDGNPDVLDVALKEAHEESGIEAINPITETIFDVTIHQVPAFGTEPAHYHYDICFLLQVTDPHAQPRNNHESHGLAWFLPEEIAGINQEKSIARMVYKWQNLEQGKHIS